MTESILVRNVESPWHVSAVASLSLSDDIIDRGAGIDLKCKSVGIYSSMVKCLNECCMSSSIADSMFFLYGGDTVVFIFFLYGGVYIQYVFMFFLYGGDSYS